MFFIRFDLAVDDNYIRVNPTDNTLKELKQSHNFETEKRKALTIPEQRLLLQYEHAKNQGGWSYNTDVTKDLKQREFGNLNSCLGTD